MVVIRLIETGEIFDTLDLKITYIKTIADIGDITKQNSSYSWGFKMPKTKNNTAILNGLGLVGDVSEAPYIKRYVSIVDNGLMIVEQGLLKVIETSQQYKAFVQDGIIEFYDEIKDDTISGVIDLSELTHENTIDAIIDSQTNDKYRYIVADYGYQEPGVGIASLTNLRREGMIPSINVLYLWDKIMEHYGWSYTGTFDLSEMWMLYPTTNEFEETTSIEVLDVIFPLQTIQIVTLNWEQKIPIATPTFDPVYIEQIGNNTHKVLSSGDYRIDLEALGITEWVIGIANIWGSYRLKMFINGEATEVYDPSSNVAGYPSVFIKRLNRNDIIEFYATYDFEQSGATNRQFQILDGTNAVITFIEITTIDFSVALVEFKVKDFFKEVMIRKALTVFSDVLEREFTFKTLDERLNADVIDWSDKYVRRLSEKYVYSSYAQSNFFKHKYDEDNKDYADGSLAVQNANLPTDKTIYQSNIYAPLEELTTYTRSSGDFFVNIFKMWEMETKIDKDDVVINEYKAIKSRYHFLQTGEGRTDGIYVDGVFMPFFYEALLNKQLFSDIITSEYGLIKLLLNRSRIHTIELMLSKADMAGLDLSKVYYFEQEMQIYLLNSLKWKDKALVKAEFIRINK